MTSARRRRADAFCARIAHEHEAEAQQVVVFLARAIAGPADAIATEAAEVCAQAVRRAAEGAALPDAVLLTVAAGIYTTFARRERTACRKKE